MKTIGLLSLIGSLCLAASPAIRGNTPSAQPTRFGVDVTVTGKMPHVSGAIGDLFLSFSGPVQVPKATLPTGTYVFVKVNPSFVRVTSADRTVVYSMFGIVGATRPGDIEHAQVRFEREAPGAPPRIVEIYPEGSSTGYAPLYPKH